MISLLRPGVFFLQCNQKLTDTQKDMEKDMDSYAGSAKDWLKEHEAVRKGEETFRKNQSDYWVV